MPGQTPIRRPRIAVTWFELFYDLVAVAVLVSMNDAFLAHPSLSTSMTASAAAAAIFTLWLLTTLAVNRYPGDTNARRVVILLQMACMVVAGLAVDQYHGLRNSWGFAAYALALLTVAFLYWLPARRGSAVPGTRTAVAGLAGAAGVALAGYLTEPGAWTWLVLIASVGVALLAMSIAHRPSVVDRYPVEPKHLGERLGQFTLLVLGLGFGQLVVDLSGTSTIPDIRFFVLTFALMFILWWMYFDFDVQDRTPLSRRLTHAWIAAHYLLLVGIVGVGDVLTALASFQSDRPLYVGGAYLGFAMFLTLIGLAMLLVTLEGMGRPAAALLGVMSVILLAYGSAMDVLDAQDLRTVGWVSVVLLGVIAVILAVMRRRLDEPPVES